MILFQVEPDNEDFRSLLVRTVIFTTEVKTPERQLMKMLVDIFFRLNFFNFTDVKFKSKSALLNLVYYLIE